MLNFRSDLQLEGKMNLTEVLLSFSDISGDVPSTGMQSVSVQNLLRRIDDLGKDMLAMEAKMVLFVKRYTVT